MKYLLIILSSFIFVYCGTTTIYKDKKVNLTVIESFELFNEGVRMNTENNLMQAIFFFTEAIKLNPLFQDSYFMRGKVYYILEKYPEALNDFYTVISFGSKNSNNYISSYFLMGNIYIKLHEYEKSIECYNNILILAPYSSDIYHERGIACLYLGRMTDAITDVTLAINIDSSKYTYFDTRGAIFFLMNMYERAFNDLINSLRLNQNNALAYANCGELLLRMEQYELSLEFFNTAIAQDPYLKTSYVGRARLYIIIAELTDDNNKKNEYIEKARDDYFNSF